MKLYNIFFCLAILSLLVSCDKEEQPPSYFHLKNIGFESNPNADNNQGSLRQNITNAYVLVREIGDTGPSEDLGYQNIPSTFPYLGSGLSTITFTPAVMVNASSSSIIEYPHFEPIVVDNRDVKLLEIDTFSLTTRYKSNDQIEFLFNEDFEANESIFRDYAIAGTDGLFVNQNEVVYEGGQSGYIHLDLADSLFVIDVATFTKYQLTTNRPFLEMDVMTDMALSFGLVATNSTTGEVIQATVGGVFDTDGVWKKVYFQLTETVSFFETRNFDEFQIYFGAQLLGTQTEGNIYIDNVKLIQQR